MDGFQLTHTRAERDPQVHLGQSAHLTEDKKRKKIKVASNLNIQKLYYLHTYDNFLPTYAYVNNVCAGMYVYGCVLWTCSILVTVK